MRPLDATLENARMVFDAVKNEDPTDYKYAPVVYPRPLPSSAQEMQAQMKFDNDRSATNGLSLYIFHDDKLVGYRRVGINKATDSFAFCDVWFIKSARGRGFAKETMQALERIAFEQLKVNRATRFCDAKNEVSVKISKSMGYNLDEELRQEHIRHFGSDNGNLAFSKMKSAYFSKKH